MIAGITESKILTKHVSCKCKCEFDGRKCNWNQNQNNDKCQCEYKKHHICEINYIWNITTYSCRNFKNLVSVILIIQWLRVRDL